MRLTDVQIARTASAVGFSSTGLVIAIAVCLAESAGRTDAVNTTGNHPPSRDRGLWQINSHYHPEVTDAEAFDAVSNARAAYRISSHGTCWTPWSTYNSGSYRQFMDRARKAAGNVVSITFTLTRLLRRGCSGSDVKRCQAIVRVTTDGVYGPVTETAVKRWQSAHRLTADGVVGMDTAHTFGWRWAG